MPRQKFVPVPQPYTSDYEDALRVYFKGYRSNILTFLYINFSTLVALKRGSLANPAIFNFKDVLSIYDRFFAADGSVSPNAFRSFLLKAEIDDESRYAHQGASHRLQTDLLEARLAVGEPRGQKPVIPKLEWVQKAVCKQLKHLATVQSIEASRLLPAYRDEIQDLLGRGATQVEIAKALTRKSVRPISQIDVSRFLAKLEDVAERIEQRKQRALMTLAMAESYIDEQELRRRIIRLPPDRTIN